MDGEEEEENDDVEEENHSQARESTLCASLRNRNAHGHFTRAISCGIYRKNAGPQACDTHFVRACAVETHMDISQEPFCVEIYRKNAARAGDHLDQTPGLNCYRKNLQCGHTVWEKR